MIKRKFRKVAKTKKGVPKSYLSGAKNKKAKEKYKKGQYINIKKVSESRAKQAKT